MSSQQNSRIAVLLHLLNMDNWQDFVLALKQINQPFDVLINLVNGLNSETILQQQHDQIRKVFPNADIMVSENRGMDIGGMFRLFERSLGKGYKALFYAHSKSDHRWRRSMLTPLTRHSSWAIDTLCQPPLDTHERPAGMVGAYFYAYDYYNIHPFMDIMSELDIRLNTSWERYFVRFPASRALSLEQRIAHATDACNRNTDYIRLRPELDLEYAQAFLDDLQSREQAVSPSLLSQMISEKVVSQLPFYPGNFFWISMQVIEKLSERLDFKTEYESLPLDLSSDQQFQSRAHAWERALPVFSMKSGLILKTLQDKTT